MSTSTVTYCCDWLDAVLMVEITFISLLTPSPRLELVTKHVNQELRSEALLASLSAVSPSMKPYREISPLSSSSFFHPTTTLTEIPIPHHQPKSLSLLYDQSPSVQWGQPYTSKVCVTVFIECQICRLIFKDSHFVPTLRSLAACIRTYTIALL